MKTLELKLKKDIFIVDAINEKIAHGIIFQKLGAKTVSDYEFLCKGSELTEEIASELVNTTWIHDKKILCKYKNYNSEGDGSYFSAVKSFKSAIESKGFYWLEKECDNQFCENGKVDLGYNSFLNCQVCEELEEKTFKNPLIFVKK